MGFSIDTEKFLINSKEAYYKFQKHQTPFAAIKVYCSGLGDEREKVDGIVDNNFRSDKDFILRSENNYAILMHNTSFKTAEAVMNRISKNLSKMRYEAKIITTAPSFKTTFKKIFFWIIFSPISFPSVPVGIDQNSSILIDGIRSEPTI